MSMSSIHVFDGGVIPGSGGSSEGANVKNLIMRNFDLTIESQTVHSKILCDYDSPRPTAPYYSPVNIIDMAQWTKDGFNIQVRLESEPRFAASLGFLAKVTIERDSSENEVTDAKVLTYERLDDHRIKFNILNFVKVIDEETSIAYLKLSSTDEFTLDSSVNTTITDILTKIPDTASSTNKLVTNQQLENAIHASVIKWSDVLAVADDDYSEFMARITANIAAGIAPIVLDDVNEGAVAILDNINEAGALFRTSTNCNERDVMFTNYVITDVAVSRTQFTKNLLFKNASNGYYPDADGFVQVKNNRNGVYTYTGANSLDFLADFDSTDAVPSLRFSDVNPPNFAVKIVSTAASDGTVNVYKKQNGIYAPLMPSVAGGTTVEAGKTYQLTCVGDCWTLAEFEEPEQVSFAMIGGKRYKVAKIGSLYWMAENLAYNATAETGDLDSASVWYDNDSSTYGDYGKLYTFTDEARAEILAAAPGWRFPTQAEMAALFTESVADLKASTGWTNAGTDGTGFSGVPGGRYFENAFGLYGSQGQWWCVPSNDPLTAFNQCYLTNDSKGTALVGDASYASVRLVKDVQ